jgi:hypothetical protein
MNDIAEVVSQSFNNASSEIYSQSVSSQEVEACRLEYLNVIQHEEKLREFLKEQSTKLQSQLVDSQISPIQTTVEFCADAIDGSSKVQHRVDFTKHFHTLGRNGHICIPDYASHVSRIHALMFHVTHQDGRGLFVILDFWSKGGTCVTGTIHESMPNDRRVLVVPDTDSVQLHLGGLLGKPFHIVLNTKLDV